MSNQIQTPPPSEEVDLGQLFQLIGNAFKRLFNFIGSIIKGIFDVIISFLLFIQKHFIKFVLAIAIGAIGGHFLDKNKAPNYISTMVVEPNFNSVQQLYNNIEFYNDLAQAEDSIALASALNIDVLDAASIKKLYLDSYSDENQKLKLFDDFIKGLDSTTVKAIDYQAYLKNFNSLDARFHKISMESTNSYVAKKAQLAIISSIATNGYFKLQKETNAENLKLKEEVYKQQLSEIDSLQKLYKTILMKEADKPMQGTSINLAGNGASSQNKELTLLKERDVLKSNMVLLNNERANKATILNVISDFPTRGVKIKGIWKSYKFLLPLALLGIVVGVLSFLELNTYLKKYKKV